MAFINSVTGFVLPKTNKLSTVSTKTDDEGLLKHVHSLEMQLKQLKAHVINHDIADVFNIIIPKDLTDTGDLATTPNGGVEAYDLFEDYSITGGVRVPTNFNGTESFATFENRVHRLDRIFSVYRRNRRLEQGFFNPLVPSRPRLIEENTLLAQYGIRYPLDVFTSLRATATVRRDRVSGYGRHEVKAESISCSGCDLTEYIGESTGSRRHSSTLYKRMCKRCDCDGAFT